MSTNTENYNLIKPDQEDFYNVDDFNNNADIIDSQLKTLSDKATSALPAASYTAADILNKLKTVDGANSGLDADLFKGESIIPVANGGSGSSNATIAIRNLGGDFVFLYRTGYDNVSGADMNSLKITGVTLTDGSAVDNRPLFFNSDGRKTVVCFNVNNYAQYNGYMAFDYYSKEIAMRMGQAQDWRRIVTDNNIAEMVQSALQSGGVSVVKSIQRGTVSTSSSSSTPVQVTINEINPAKSILIINDSNTTYIDKDNSDNIDPTYYYSAGGTLINGTTIEIHCTEHHYSTYRFDCNWQVIEFY